LEDFTLEDLTLMWEESASYRDIYYNLQHTQEKFGWWCLGHNFDVVATILTMAHLSWQKGFDAGLAIADFADRPPWAGPNSVQKYHRYDHANPINTGPIQLRPHSGD
jgi:hypothetical protein